MTKKRDRKPSEQARQTTPEINAPMPVKIIGWFGICFSLTFIIMGVVSIVLSFLDRTFADLAENIIIIFYGLPILIVSVGFKNMQKWGWYGLLGIFGLAVIWSVFSYTDGYGIAVGLLTLFALIGLLLPTVRKHYFPA